MGFLFHTSGALPFPAIWPSASYHPFGAACGWTNDRSALLRLSDRSDRRLPFSSTAGLTTATNQRASEASAAAAVGSVSDQHAHFREDEGEGENEEEKRWKGEALKERLTMQRGI